MLPFCIGRPGLIKCKSMFRFALHVSMSSLVNSPPLSDLMVSGNVLVRAIWSNTRITRRLGNEKSISVAMHSREKSSMIVKMRNFRPVDNVSWTKSIDHRSFGARLAGSHFHAGIGHRACGEPGFEALVSWPINVMSYQRRI